MAAAAAAAASELNKYPVSWLKWYPILFTWQVPAPKSGMKWGLDFVTLMPSFMKPNPFFAYTMARFKLGLDNLNPFSTYYPLIFICRVFSSLLLPTYHASFVWCVGRCGFTLATHSFTLGDETGILKGQSKLGTKDRMTFWITFVWSCDDHVVVVIYTANLRK
jgi:hypothetical protein